MKNIDKKDEELIEEAKRVAIKFSKETYHSCVSGEERRLSTVGAALRVEDGTVYSGPNIYHAGSNPASIDAEYAAVAKAYSDGHRNFDTIVSYWFKDKNKQKVLAPCGQCRELLKLFGDLWVILPTEKGIKKERLSKLLPY